MSRSARFAAMLPALSVVLLAAATHLLGSSGWPVWTDEGWTAWATADPAPASIIGILAVDRHPPLYFLLLGAWRTLAGDSRLALRALSIFSGILSTALVYRLGRDAFDRRAAGYGAALFAVLPLAVYFTQAARHYGLLILLACLSALLFLRYLCAPSGLRLAAYALSAVLLLYTHYQAVLVIGIQALYGLLLWDAPRRERLRLLAGYAAAGVAFLPWALVIAGSQGVGEIARASTGAPGTYTSAPADLLALSGVLTGGQLALLGGALVLGLWRLAEAGGWRRERAGAVVVALGGVGLLALMIAANLLTGVLTDRTAAVLTPFVLLVAGYGLASLPRRAGHVLTAAAVLVLLVIPGAIQPSLPLDVVASALAADYSPGDVIVLELGWDDRAAAYELGLVLPPAVEADLLATLPWVDHIGPAEPALPHVQPRLAEAHRVWVVQWFQAPSVLPYLDDPASGFRRVITRTVPIGAEYAAQYPDHPVITAALFERVDAATTIDLVFGDVFTLKHALLPESVTPGAALHVDLWWSALAAPALDYSVGVFLLDGEGRVLAQHDGPPGGESTTAWQPGAPHFDRHTLAIPAGLPPGEYALGVSVYWYGDGVPLPVADGSSPAILGRVTLPPG